MTSFFNSGCNHPVHGDDNSDRAVRRRSFCHAAAAGHRAWSDRYATFVQMNEEQVEALQNDPRLSYTGVSVSLGTVELSRALHLDLIEFGMAAGRFSILYAASGRKAAGTGDGNRAAGGCAASDGG